jgi:hypothetical protein
MRKRKGRRGVMKKLAKSVSFFLILCRYHVPTRISYLFVGLIIFCVGLVGSSPAKTVAPRDIIFFNFHQGILLNRPALFSDHPLLDAVIMQVSWPEVEPSKGVFDFGPLDARIDIWNKAGKSVMLKVVPYSQDNGNDSTPAWIYDTVPSIVFTSTRLGTVKIPVVWSSQFFTEYSAFILTLARKYNRDLRVQYIGIGIGQGGSVNAESSQEAKIPFLQAGWTLDVWENYIDNLIGLYYSNFKRKQLVITMASQFLTGYNMINNIQTGERIAEYAASKKYYILFKGIDQDPVVFNNTGIPAIVQDLASLNLNNPSLGFSDDLPLFSTAPGGRTAADFQAILDNVYNLWVSINKKYPIFLVLLDNELAATQIGNTNTGNKSFNVDVYNSLVDFINKVN